VAAQLLHEVDRADDEDARQREHHHHRQAQRPILVVDVPHLRGASRASSVGSTPFSRLLRPRKACQWQIVNGKVPSQLQLHGKPSVQSQSHRRTCLRAIWPLRHRNTTSAYAHISTATGSSIIAMMSVVSPTPCSVAV
jgi:hypothetical protein